MILEQKSLAKFFGSFLGGNQATETKPVASSDLVPVKDHPTYSKYFRLVSVGGNIMDIRRQMREAGLDENLIHAPEKLISTTSHQSADHLRQAQATLVKSDNAAFGSYLSTADSHNTDGDAESVHVDDRNFTSLFKKKPQTEPASTPAVTVSSLVEVFLSKPLGITLGENVEDEEQGVHVSSCAAGGNAAVTGLIHPGMLLLEACGKDVRQKDFDSVMDILRGAPAGEKIKLVFSPLAEAGPPSSPAEEAPGDSDVSETSSVDRSVVSVPPVKAEIEAALEPSDTDVSETSSVDRSVINVARGPQAEQGATDLSGKAIVQVALEPNDTDVSETSSVDQSIAEHKQLQHMPQETPGEPTSSTDRRDSIKSVSSVGSTHSQTSVHSHSSHHSRQSTQGPASVLPQEIAEEKSDIAPVKSAANRSSFALRKAAAIRNAAARKREASSLPEPSTVVLAENPLKASQGSAAFAQPGGVFGIGDDYDSDPENEPPPVLSKSLLAPGTQEDQVEQVEWRSQEPVVSIPNPHIALLERQPSVELENSQIIGRPRAPRKHLPSILNRMKRQQSGDSVGSQRPERGGIARISSRPIEEAPAIPVARSSPSPTHSLNSYVPMNDLLVGTTGSVKVPLPASLLEKVLQPTPSASSGPIAAHSFPASRDDGLSAGNWSSGPWEQEEESDRFVQDLPKKPDILPARGGNELEPESRARRVTPLGKHFRGLRSQMSSKQQTPPVEKVNPVVAANGPAVVSEPRSPQLALKSRRDGLLIQSRGDSDPDSDSSTFSPQLVHKPVGSFSSTWNNSPPSIPKLGSHFSNSSQTSLPRHETSESESSRVSGSRSSVNVSSSRQQRAVHQPSRTKTVDAGVQSDYAAYIDEQYLNSYQMLLGERQQLDEIQEIFRIECEERLDMLREEELSAIDRMRRREAESYQRIQDEEDRLTARVHEVEDIILSEKEEIERQWQELHQAELEAHDTHEQKTSELLELLHIVRAHHDKLQADKKKIGRQRLQLDLALQDLNKFNHFTPHHSSPVEGKASGRRGYSPNAHSHSAGPGAGSASLGRRAMSPVPLSASQSNWQKGLHSSPSPSRAPSRDRSFGNGGAR
jgi:hypothetical protein